MIKIFLDANIVLDLMFMRDNSKRTREMINDLRKNKNFVFTISSNTLNIIFYVGSEKYKSWQQTMDKLKKIDNPLNEFWQVVDNTSIDRQRAYKYCDDNANADWEDVLQYLCAKKANCDFIITNDKNFPQLDIPLKRTNINISDYNLKKEKNV